MTYIRFYDFRVCVKAKVNLFLKVLDKRADQYHNIVTVLQTIDIADELLFEKSDRDLIRLESDSKYLPLDDRNLVWRAIDILKRAFPDRVPGFTVAIRKDIPVGAGLGGGSADAAAALAAVNRLCNLGLSDEKLAGFARQLGMDVPFFLNGGTMKATERGDVLKPLRNATKYWIVVVFPGFAISTREAYELVDAGERKKALPSDEFLADAIEGGDIEAIAHRLYNEFEELLLPRYPIIGEIKRDLLNQGCSGAVLSGSGSSVFGIARDRQSAESTAKEMEKKHSFVRFCSTDNESISFA